LWFLERLEPGLPAYTVPFAWRLTGPLDAAALGRALLRLVERHDALRTVFPVADGEPVQRVQPAGDVPLAVEDLADLPPPQREARLADWPAAEAARPFDLEHGPMFRAGPACLGPAEHVLLLNMHHIVCDGWSLAVLAEELGAVYAAEASGAVPDLPPPPMRFADFAARQCCGDGPPARAMAYWRQRPAGLAAVPVLPADRPRPATRTRRCHCIPVTLPAELTARLTELGRGADGVGRGGVVAVYARRGGDLAAAMLGIHRAGAAFLILDPEHPPRRLAEYLEIAAPVGRLRLPGTAPVAGELAERLAAMPLRSRRDLNDPADAEAPADRRPRRGRRPRRPGLRGVHLGLDRPAQGGGRAARAAAAPPGMARPHVRPDRGRPVRGAQRAGPRPAAPRSVHPAVAGGGHGGARAGRHPHAGSDGGLGGLGGDHGPASDPESAADDLRRRPARLAAGPAAGVLRGRTPAGPRPDRPAGRRPGVGSPGCSTPAGRSTPSGTARP
jgi:hypothetical protein